MIKWFWRYTSKLKMWFVLAFVLVIAYSGLNMVNPYITGTIVDKVIMQGKSSMLIKLVSLLLIVTLLKSIIRYIFQFIFESCSQNIIYNLRKDLYTNLQKLDQGFYEKTRTGDIMARMTGDIDAVRHFFAWVIYSAFDNILIFIFSIIIMFTINVKLTLIILAFTPPVAVLTRRLSKAIKPNFEEVREGFSRLNSTVQENISGNRVVKAFAKEDYEIEKFEKENLNFKDKNIKASNVWGVFIPKIDFFSGVLNVVVILFGGYFVIKDNMTIGELVTINSLIFAVNNPLRMAGWIVNDTERFLASAKKIREFIDIDTKIKDTDKPMQKEKIKGNIEFKNVSFGYEGEEEVLHNINLNIKNGQTIGVVGPTGSGKSTLVNLICRFYDPREGNVLIDKVDARNMSVKKLRDNIAVAMQDIFLFSDTIEGNIAYGVPTAEYSEVEYAAKLAGAHDFIKDFPEGYDTIVGERGVGLSGGQKQRIALARALIKDPAVLILDDTTSAVDMETEHRIQKSLNSVASEKTTIIIAHRISSVKNADKIIVLDKGRLIEEGTHEELIKNKGYYYSVYLNQFGNFDETLKGEVG